VSIRTTSATEEHHVVDHGHDLLFGSFLTSAASDPARAVALAQLADRSGLDLLGVQDHPYQPALLDAWTLLSFAAAATERITVFPDVASLPLRGPVVLARSAAGLDLLTGGRVELGLGAGAFADAVAANGGPRRTPAESVTALEEAITVIRAVWAGGPPVRVEGEHYRVVGAKSGPRPAHDMGLWLGAYKPRMLSVTGRLADGWIPSSAYTGPADLAAMNEMVDEAAERAGRPPAAVRRLYNISGSFAGRPGFLQGRPQDWAEQLAELTLTQGMSGYVLASDDPSDVQRFAAEVAPAVREAVAAARSGWNGSNGLDRSAPPPAPPVVIPAARPRAVALWDETSRPTAVGTGPPSPARDRSGDHLVLVHDHLRSELTQLQALVQQVADGATDAGAARSHIVAMTLRQNTWVLGTYCEAYCALVTGHHSTEDRSLFPSLRRTEPALGPVLDRLGEEHGVIHDVIERVDRSLVAMVTDPGELDHVRAAVDLLGDALLSHLAYEEHELLDPLERQAQR
jgi:alkanesulfonate monooxygenase SsuD/methylene tetrahydromethanopterin reductase-like flavin-dependent oxidoreductase (luciferase family)